MLYKLYYLSGAPLKSLYAVIYMQVYTVPSITNNVQYLLCLYNFTLKVVQWKAQVCGLMVWPVLLFYCFLSTFLKF